MIEYKFTVCYVDNDYGHIEDVRAFGLFDTEEEASNHMIELQLPHQQYLDDLAAYNAKAQVTVRAFLKDLKLEYVHYCTIRDRYGTPKHQSTTSHFLVVSEHDLQKGFRYGGVISWDNIKRVLSNPNSSPKIIFPKNLPDLGQPPVAPQLSRCIHEFHVVDILL